ncbi:MAG TPA: hypothetical protein VFA26_05630 [Gemmataceae bacterium]|nr:hypothetical protein [Gemmataceae bacterium]
MFTLEEMRALVNARPFVPFRLYLSDGGTVDVRHRELVLIGRRFAVVGLPDPGTADTLFDRWAVVWYLHVTRAEMLEAGPPPFGPPPGPAESPTPTPA